MESHVSTFRFNHSIEFDASKGSLDSSWVFFSFPLSPPHGVLTLLRFRVSSVHSLEKYNRALYPLVSDSVVFPISPYPHFLRLRATMSCQELWK